MRNILFFYGIVLLTAIQGCTSEDVKPTVSLESTSTNLEFNNGTVNVFAVLNGVINKEITVKLSFHGTAIQGTDYTTSGTEITISAGSDRGNIVLTGLPTTDTARKQILISLETSDGEVVNINSTLEISMGTISRLGLIINEVLYDPPSGEAGDANRDGTRDPLADEFVELYNDGDELDISGYTLSDAAMMRHRFPSGTIIPSKGVVLVFGGGTPSGDFGGAVVLTASEGQLNLNNAGDVLTLRNSQDSVLQVFNINGLNGNPDQSYSRNPDIKGPFELHSAIPSSGAALFSPGTRVNGTKF